MKSLCSMVNDMNAGVLGVDTYGHFNTAEEREQDTVMLAEDAEWNEGDIADDADELGKVFGQK